MAGIGIEIVYECVPDMSDINIDASLGGVCAAWSDASISNSKPH